MCTESSLTSFPTSTSALLFPAASNNLSQTLASIKCSTLSITNRLASIDHDSLFVKHVAAVYKFPVIANERCGSWYIQQELKSGSAYFKSTDGHHGQWSFSLRRLNLQLLGILEEYNGCIIVDSTRRGKMMPDALAKTVPTWCAVINRLVFGNKPDGQRLRTPRGIVGASEHAQIEARLDRFVEEAKCLELNTILLASKLKKPLRPFWVTPDAPFPALPNSTADFYPVLCCTASRRVAGAEASKNGYIQGAGDDNECWSCGLTPLLFWQHRQQLMSTVEHELPDTIRGLLAVKSAETNGMEAVLIKPTATVFVGALNTVHPNKFEGIIICSSDTLQSHLENCGESKNILHLRSGAGKLGSRALRTQLSLLPAFMQSCTARSDSPRILCACPTGNDLCIGVALAVLCLSIDDNGQYDAHQPLSNNLMDKAFIRRRLAWITTVKADANPSRSTLQAVNAFLMKKPN